MNRLCTVLICMPFLFACTTQKAAQPLKAFSLEGEWKLQTLNGSTVATLKRPITINFTETEKRISGYAGCNQYFSSYMLNGSSINFTSPGRTKMYCQETMSIEEEYLRALTDTGSIKSEADKLIFLNGETILLEFSR